MAKRIYACPNCGLQVGVNDNVCTNCGTSLENKVIIENGKVVANNNQVNKDSTVRFSNDPTFSLTHNLITNESPLLIKKADLYTRSNIIDLNIEFMNLSNKNIKAIKVIPPLLFVHFFYSSFVLYPFSYLLIYIKSKASNTYLKLVLYVLLIFLVR